MRTIKQFTISALVAALLLGVAGCTGMSQRDKNTAIGAGVGAVGGAAVGGIIGNQIDKDDN